MDTNDTTEPTYTLFAGDHQVAAGMLQEVLPKAKELQDARDERQLLLFENATAEQVDFDMRGTLDEVLRRAMPPPSKPGPGRPRLGVVSREITLLPRHWEWLEDQPNGASATLRRLVDEARKRDPGRQRARRATEAANRFMTAMAGNRPNYEEASRALFAGEIERLRQLTQDWPEDVRAYLQQLLHRGSALRTPRGARRNPRRNRVLDLSLDVRLRSTGAARHLEGVIAPFDDEPLRFAPEASEARLQLLGRAERIARTLDEQRRNPDAGPVVAALLRRAPWRVQWVAQKHEALDGKVRLRLGHDLRRDPPAHRLPAGEDRDARPGSLANGLQDPLPARFQRVVRVWRAPSSLDVGEVERHDRQAACAEASGHRYHERVVVPGAGAGSEHEAGPRLGRRLVPPGRDG
jgi:hypothetical protein